MAIARDRAEVMAANDVMSHTEPERPEGLRPDQRRRADLVRRRRDHRLEQLSDRSTRRPRRSAPGWPHPATRRSCSRPATTTSASAPPSRPSGKLYYAGVFVKEPDETGAWAQVPDDRARRSLAAHTSGHDPLDGRRHAAPGPDRGPALLRGPAPRRRRHVARVGITTATTSSVTVAARPTTYEVRVRARDRAGNWGAWRVIRIKL